MKHLRETFTDQEFAQLQTVKKLSGKNWHDFLLMLVPTVIVIGKDMTDEEIGELKRKWQTLPVGEEVKTK